MEISQLSIFLNHKLIPGTFPSLHKVALSKQDIYLLLSVGVTRNFSLQNSKFSLFLTFFANFHKFAWIFCYIYLKAWPMYNKVIANIALNCYLRVVNNFYTHLATKMLRCLNAVLGHILTTKLL